MLCPASDLHERVPRVSDEKGVGNVRPELTIHTDKS